MIPAASCISLILANQQVAKASGAVDNRRPHDCRTPDPAADRAVCGRLHCTSTGLAQAAPRRTHAAAGDHRRTAGAVPGRCQPHSAARGPDRAAASAPSSSSSCARCAPRCSSGGCCGCSGRSRARMTICAMSINNGFLFPFVIAVWGQVGFAQMALFDFGNALCQGSLVYAIAAAYGGHGTGFAAIAAAGAELSAAVGAARGAAAERVAASQLPDAGHHGAGHGGPMHPDAGHRGAGRAVRRATAARRAACWSRWRCASVLGLAAGFCLRAGCSISTGLTRSVVLLGRRGADRIQRGGDRQPRAPAPRTGGQRRIDLGAAGAGLRAAGAVAAAALQSSASAVPARRRIFHRESLHGAAPRVRLGRSRGAWPPVPRGAAGRCCAALSPVLAASAARKRRDVLRVGAWPRHS